jgi:hypothetical protein
LEPYARFDGSEHSFYLIRNPFPEERVHPGPYRIGKLVEDTNIYRVGHPLAQRIIQECKARDLPVRELTLDYSGTPTKVTILESLVGRSGWLHVSCVTVTAFETEDFVIPVGMCDDGTLLDVDQCCRLFSLNGTCEETTPPTETNDDPAQSKLRKRLARVKKELLEDIGTKNAHYFEMELDKLDKWGEDKRASLRIALKELDDEIKELKKEARLAPNLPEKLPLERKRRQLEAKRDEAWRDYDAAAKEIDRMKDELIDEIEKKLQHNVVEEELFTVHWKII